MRWLTAVAIGLLLSGCATRSDGPTPPAPPTPSALEGRVALNEIWRAQVGPTDPSLGGSLRPVLEGGRLYVASGERRDVRAFHADTGAPIWTTQLERRIAGGIGFGAGSVAVGGRDAWLTVLDAESGALRWETKLNGEILSAPAIDATTLVVRSSNGQIIGFDAQNGRRLWTYDYTPPPLSLHGTSRPIMVGGLVLVGLETGRLLALDSQSGGVVWNVEVASPSGRTELERMADIDGDPAIVGQNVFAASYQGHIVAVGLNNGRMAWGREFSSYTGLGADLQAVYAVDDAGVLWSFDSRNGNAAWSLDALRGTQLATPVVHGDYIVSGDDTGHLNWVRRQDGALLARTRVGSGAIVEPVLTANGRLYVLTSRGELAAYEAVQK